MSNFDKLVIPSPEDYYHQERRARCLVNFSKAACASNQYHIDKNLKKGGKNERKKEE